MPRITFADRLNGGDHVAATLQSQGGGTLRAIALPGGQHGCSARRSSAPGARPLHVAGRLKPRLARRRPGADPSRMRRFRSDRDGKPVFHSFPKALLFSCFRTENRFALFLETLYKETPERRITAQALLPSSIG